MCSVSAIQVNKVLLQELNQLLGMKMLTLHFLKMFGSAPVISLGHYRERRVLRRAQNF